MIWTNCLFLLNMSFLLRKVEEVTTISQSQSLTSARIKACTLRAPNKTTVLFFDGQFKKAIFIEQIELQAKLLNYFLGSNKSNINQFTGCFPDPRSVGQGNTGSLYWNIRSYVYYTTLSIMVQANINWRLTSKNKKWQKKCENKRTNLVETLIMSPVFCKSLNLNISFTTWHDDTK